MSRWALVLLLGCSPAPAPQAVVTQPLAGPCATCHAEEARTWHASLHRASFTDADFQKSFAIEPLDFCVSCHAPEASSRKDLPGLARGVGCASCHAGVQAPVAGHHPAPSTAVPCAKCHEFDFPQRPLAMQSTQTEHDQLAFAAVPCAGCHMAAGGHRFDVTRNVPWLEAALEPPELSWRGPEARITLRTHRVGHAFPTGDLFRRALLTVWFEDAAHHVVSYEQRVLGKRYAPETNTVEDTRIFGERVETYRLDARPAGGTAHVDVTYQRVAFPTAHDVSLFAAVPVLSATLDIPTP